MNGARLAKKSMAVVAVLALGAFAILPAVYPLIKVVVEHYTRPR